MTGAAGLLGTEVVAEAKRRRWPVLGVDRDVLDVTDAGAVEDAVERHRPDAVVHCAAYTAVDRAEGEPAAAMAVNRDGTRNVARAADARNALLVYPSTDYVFDGALERPYRPADAPRPLSVYGASKRAGEEEAGNARRSLVVRTSWLYGSGGRNFVDAVLRRAVAGETLQVVDDQRGRPTWTGSLAPVLLDLAQRGVTGTLHAADTGTATWLELAREALRRWGLPEERVQPTTTEAWGAPARRPRWSVLDVSATEALLGRPLRPWPDALADYLEERRAAARRASASPETSGAGR